MNDNAAQLQMTLIDFFFFLPSICLANRMLNMELFALKPNVEKKEKP